MLSLPPTVKLWFATQPVDMRLGFDGLHQLVRSRLNADPLSGHLFVFRNRTADRLKVLYWGGHGLCLWCQRLERGRYHFPDKPDEAGVQLTPGEFQMILDGIDLSNAKRFKGCVLRFSQRHPALERLSVVGRGRFRAGRGRSGIRSRTQENTSLGF